MRAHSRHQCATQGSVVPSGSLHTLSPLRSKQPYWELWRTKYSTPGTSTSSSPEPVSMSPPMAKGTLQVSLKTLRWERILDDWVVQRHLGLQEGGGGGV